VQKCQALNSTPRNCKPPLEILTKLSSIWRVHRTLPANPGLANKISFDAKELFKKTINVSLDEIISIV
jgi:hypothetical protein